MTTKHTPGPWTMETVQTQVGVCFKVGPFPWKEGKINHACIYADYPGNGPEYHELVANARLIAAAPDLLAALQTLDTCDLSGLPGDVVRMCRDAIAKATGV